NDGDINNASTNWGRVIDSFWYNVPLVMPSDTLGCSSIPAGTFGGKFALISRGTCQFSEKAYSAQQAGAIGVVIYNNDPTSMINMAQGNNSGLVNIPVILISQADGIALSKLIQNNQPVHVSLTNWGFGF